jgi:excisionase family DNA binding protein
LTGRSPRDVEPSDLPPRARKAMAARALVDAVEGFVRECFRERDARDEWVDQDASPLGRRRHLALARRGDLPAVKDGRRVLVKRGDLDSYLHEHPVRNAPNNSLRRPEEASRASAIAAELLGDLGLTLCGAS